MVLGVDCLAAVAAGTGIFSWPSWLLRHWTGDLTRYGKCAVNGVLLLFEVGDNSEMRSSQLASEHCIVYGSIRLREWKRLFLHWEGGLRLNCCFPLLHGRRVADYSLTTDYRTKTIELLRY